MDLTLIFWSPISQITLALILGSFIGLERTFAGKTAGMRTYGLVSMSSCIFVVISGILGAGLNLGPDVLRIAPAIVTGIGFLGACLIIFKESKLSGLTTAAGLWVACGVGIAVGFGFYTIAIFASALTVFDFTILWYIENWIKKLASKNNKDNSGESGGELTS